MIKALLGLSTMVLASTSFAADYSDDIHKNDYSWKQFNLMYAFDELPGESSHDYLEMEFGGRSGVVDLYGYLDVFNVTSSDSSDKADSDKMFLKLAPRFSLDGMTGKDLSFGAVQELYVSTLFSLNGGQDGTNNSFFGLGADVDMPWLGKVGMNLYALYDKSQGNRNGWNGYQFSANWFKPFKTFDNGSFLAYQGYVDYQFGMDSDYVTATDGGATFQGLYWHSKQYALGYGLKIYKDVYGIKDSSGFKSSGVSHYISATYKF
ncbi:nucleoside-specific channel-forming Tsx family protein [Marinomonas profundimaris]|uniref:Membrane protein n=1 Tax=Marinomonas profundimaris TaxID=1208321 RepID=W1RNG9_9GAMM|nr:outer membrane protein OmpK [Marinomonas profundimaris]ETI58161.1 membrane protein [Marinomonas profundimaris]